MNLHERLRQDVLAWRASGWAHDAYPAIAEVLEWTQGSEGNPRFLRAPQLAALETYWYLRLVRDTAHVADLYATLFTDPAEHLQSLGLEHPDLAKEALRAGGIDGLLDRVRRDDDLVKRFKLEALRETLTLDYPSYILALAMGAGKTLLIGAIVATEFAMALEYPDAAFPFVQNALVFAPGKTIIESLRELLGAPYGRMLPPRMHKGFAAAVKFTFTRDGDPDIPVIRGSLFNVVVTNTEKIRIRKEQVRKGDLGPLFGERKLDEAREDVANRRLQAIASLPHLAVFSDEAHHTYGQSLESGLKKVRRTVDYLAANTNVIAVVNTTGTPYYQRQMLRDVVIWYGLSQGIRDGILKDVANSIQSYDFDGDTAAYLRHVITDFFKDYRDVTLPNGAPAKLAVYFPQTDDLAELRPVIDEALVAAGLSPALALANTSNPALTKKADEDAFNRLNDPLSPHRVVLLVNKGTEGWNCPSLFACALARKLKASNNFVLQAATRCLRQVPGNSTRARIYLSQDNYGVLDRQLRETYGEEIATLTASPVETRTARIVLRRPSVPPVLLHREERTVVRADPPAADALTLVRPTSTARKASMARYSLTEPAGASRVLRQVEASIELTSSVAAMDVSATATALAGRYRLAPLAVKDALAPIYPDGDVPLADIDALAGQLEEQTRSYAVRSERVDVALALVKPEGFTEERDEEGRAIYTAEITYRVDRESYLTRWSDMHATLHKDRGFFYDPIEFDSKPEQEFFRTLLQQLDVQPWDVEDVYFTGGLTDPSKTDFFVEYKAADGRWRRYVPDFVIRKRPALGGPPGSGRVLIVEIKREKARDDRDEGPDGTKAVAIRAWEDLNPDRVKYEMIFTGTDTVSYDQMRDVFRFAEAKELYLPIEIDRDAIATFCDKWKVSQLDLFGSIVTGGFGPDSDVDMLVTFADNAAPGLDVVHMANELEGIVGRKVDLLTRRAVEQSDNWIRRKNILESAKTLHVS
ncbi:MAG: nucleotidyltransferase domain-containing protein [Vicinamibacterales bacterium]